VARDRQRAKQRRRQRQDGQGTGAGRGDAARDAGLEDDAVASPLGEGTAAPGPLDHASAEVDQAKLAEAGAVRGGSGDAEAEPFDGDDDAYEIIDDPADRVDPDAPAAVRAPDQVEGDQTPVRRGELDPSVAEETAGATTRSGKPRGRVLAFLGHCVDELRRVQWPDRRQVGQATAVVLGFVVIAGGYLGLMDAIWKPLVQAIL